MPRELMKEKRERAIAIAQRMDEHFPAAECALHYWEAPIFVLNTMTQTGRLGKIFVKRNHLLK